MLHIARLTIWHLLTCIIKLEIRDRAQLEASLSPKSDWKFNLGCCRACWNLWSKRSLPPKKSTLVGQHECLNFVVSGPKFAKFFCPWDVPDQVLFRFSLRRSVTAIFAITVLVTSKTRQILDVFLSQILLGAGPKSYTLVITPAYRHVTW